MNQSTTLRTVRELMTLDPVTMASDDKVSDAARAMQASNIGTVLIKNGSQLEGLITDRDIVTRTVAEGKDPQTTKLGDILSKPTHTLAPTDSIDTAVKIMSDGQVRRIPVVEGERCVGIVSLGDLAIERDPKSVLGRISSAPSNN